MRMDLKWYEIALFSVLIALGNARAWIQRTALWRFYRAHLAPLDGLEDATTLRRARLPRPGRPARNRALTLPLPPPSRLELSFHGVMTAFEPWSWVPAMQTQKQRGVTADQAGSGLLTRLPQDVRIAIFELVLGGRGFHMSCGSTRGHIDCFGICGADTLMLETGGHGDCHVRRKQHLLPLLLTCRHVYSEAVYVLYAANVFEFTQEFCLVKFVNAVPAHRLRSIRRLRHYLSMGPRHPALNRRTMSDWAEIWAFFGSRFEGLTVLRVEIGMDFKKARRVCSEAENECEWVLPVVRSAFTEREGPRVGSAADFGQRTLLVGVPGGVESERILNVNAAWQLAEERLEPGHSAAELEGAVCRDVHAQIQKSLRGWLQAHER